MDANNRTRKSMLSGKTLYDDLKHIPIYKNHRESLRPWDRALPAIVEQEANRRALWITKPPSGLQIFGLLVLCLAVCLTVTLLPFIVNAEYIALVWRDIAKPEIVYHDARVLLAVSIVVHITTGFALWFVYLSEGFSKHQLELIPFSLALLLESIWMDIVFYARRLDWALMLWVAILLCILCAQFLLVRGDVHISAIFLAPAMAAALVVVAYCVEFWRLHGDTLHVKV
jgi:tryptophan-rich sensory protein